MPVAPPRTLRLDAIEARDVSRSCPIAFDCGVVVGAIEGDVDALFIG